MKKKLFKKDRYGVLRGSMLVGALIIICTLLFVGMMARRDVSFEMEHASLAAKQAAMQVNHVVNEQRKALDETARAIKSLESDESSDLAQPERHGGFTDAWIEKGEIADYISVSEAGILLRADLGDGRILCARMDAEQLGSVFENLLDGDFAYAVFNTETGECVINTSDFQNGGYYDILHSVNENGAAEELLNGENAQAKVRFNGKNYCFAQQSTDIKTLSIALFLPEAILADTDMDLTGDMIFVVCCTIIMLLVLAVHTVQSSRRIDIANRNAARAVDMSDTMVRLIAKDAKVSAFVYQKNGDRLISCHDGMNLLQGGNITSLKDFHEVCGLAEGETERIYDRVGELMPGENAEILAQCLKNNDEESMLRFNFHASDDEMRNVICTISDCTNEQDAEDFAERERRYLQSVQNKTSSIWQINVSRNRWWALHCKKRDLLHAFAMEDKARRDYSADLSGQLREYLHPGDYETYRTALSITALAAAYRSGRNEFSLDYRVGGRQADVYEWHRMIVRIWMDAKTCDILANMYVFNVDAEKNAELERRERKRVLQQTLMALGGMYFGLYYVDLDNDLCYTARSLGGELVNQLSTPYKLTFDGYIDANVHPDDREELRKALSAYMLRKSMTEGSHFQKLKYRRKVGDDGYRNTAMIIQPARFENGAIREVVLAVQFID